MLNLLFLGESLTEGVPDFNVETDTMPFMVNQQFPGATYIKLGYRGQTSSYLHEKSDGSLYSQFKPGDKSVLVLWTSTNDCALSLTAAFNRSTTCWSVFLEPAHPVGRWWVITMIAPGN